MSYHRNWINSLNNLWQECNQCLFKDDHFFSLLSLATRDSIVLSSSSASSLVITIYDIRIRHARFIEGVNYVEL